MAFLVKALSRWNKCSKNADISILSNFLAIFSNFFLDIEKFYQVLYIHAKFKINWTIQTGITEGGGGGAESVPLAIPICKKPGLFRVEQNKDLILRKREKSMVQILSQVLKRGSFKTIKISQKK